MTDQESKHRGRVQAQGNKLEASEAWSQDTPPTVEDGLNFLQQLADKITKSEFLVREKEFKKAAQFIKQAGDNGGIDAKVSKTFKKKGTKDVRVDIEVIKGTAFVKDNREGEDESK